MTKYHINPETGRANQCYAKKTCRFGADTKHYATKEEARAGYEKSMKDSTVSKPLKKSSEKASAESKPLEIIPGVPPVLSKLEINQEAYDIYEEMREMGVDYRISEILEMRDVTLKDIEEEERSGNYSVGVKIPGYSEIDIHTDVARAALKLEPRKATGIDETPLRKAEIELLEAKAGTYGSFKNSDDYSAAQKKMRDAKERYDRLRNPDYSPPIKPAGFYRGGGEVRHGGWGYGNT